MKLLEAQPEVTPGTPPEPPGETPQDSAATDPAARSCTSCGAAMVAGQDWCLACGHAAAPLSERAGWRSAMTVLGITLALVAGAVVASYAALSDDPGAASATSTAQVAAAPPAAAPAPPAAPAAGADTTPTTGTTTTKGSSALPKVSVPSSSSRGAAPRSTSTSSSATPRVTPPAPAPVSPSSGSGSTPPSSSPGSPSSGTGTTTTPAPSPPAELKVAAEEASIYDPYHRAVTVGDPGRAVDGDAGTSWFVDPPPGSTNVNVGYAIDLRQSRGVRSIDLTTLTPGFKVEVYATDEVTPPPDILDTRWAHITDRANVGTDGATERIVLGAGTSKYRMVMLWITQPPSDGTRVRISELKIFG